jgi:2-C-methyl-D-erythritol 4-phosphate cytidylyltransferase
MGFFRKLFGSKEDTGKRPFVSVVVVAAGSSGRMNGEDKLFAVLAGAPVLAHSLLAFDRNPLVDEIVVVTKSESIARVGELIGDYGISKASCVVHGGETRQASALIGVTQVAQKAQLIAIHDGARPLITQKIITDAISTATLYDTAVPALPVKETIKSVSAGRIVSTMEREKLYAAQTPQVFKAELIKAALTDAVNKGVEVTDDSMAVERLGSSVRVTEGSPENIKLTYPADLYAAEGILTCRTQSEQ